jgi:hypothetical protein
MAENRLPSYNDESYRGIKADYIFVGLEELEPFAAYRYSREYELYCVPSRVSESGKDRLFIYNKAGTGEMVICDRDDGQRHICVGTLYSRMNKEEKAMFAANFARFKEITGLKESA